MSGLVNLFNSFSGSFGGTTNGFGGLSDADMALIEQAQGLGTEAIHNRYAQLGLGVPSGDPISAAASGESLTYGGPSTMEMGDIGGLAQMAQAAQGQLQINNQNNPAISGTAANQAQGLQGLAQQQQQTGFSSNLASDAGTLAAVAT